MFVIETVNENGWEKIILKDEKAGTHVEIVPSCGGILHSFTVTHNGSTLNIIDSYADGTDFRNNVTANGFKGCKLSPFACRVNNAHYRFGEEEYTIEKFLLGKNALHGLLYDAVFIVNSQSADEQHAAVSMLYAYRQTDKGYPFNYDCVVKYSLAKDNALTVSTQIINKDEGLIPVQDGWHPYFKFDGSINELQLEFQSGELVVFDDLLIPTGELLPYHQFGSLETIGNTSFDNCYTLDFTECQPLCVLRDPVKKIQLEVYPNKNYPYLQIYTPAHRNSIAIENLSAAPDTFNNKMGLIILQHGESRTFTTTYKITPLI